MRLPNLAPGDRRAVLIGVAVAAPIALWMLVATPYLHAVAETRAKLEVGRDLLARERRLLAGSKRYPVVLDEGKARLAAVAGRLFDGASEAAISTALAAHLRQHARASRVHLSELKSAPPDTLAAGVATTSLNVTGESDLEGLLTFLRSLESGTKLVHIDQLEIESAQRSGGAVGPEVLSFQLTAKGFALPEASR